MTDEHAWGDDWKSIGEAMAVAMQRIAGAMAAASASMQRYGKTLRAAEHLLRVWEAGDRRPTYVYGDALQLVPASALKRLGAMVDEFPDFSIVTFDPADRAVAIASARTGSMFSFIGELNRDLDNDIMAMGTVTVGEAIMLGEDIVDHYMRDRPELPRLTVNRRQPAYLQHDPTKRVTKRRRR